MNTAVMMIMMMRVTIINEDRIQSVRIQPVLILMCVIPFVLVQ